MLFTSPTFLLAYLPCVTIIYFTLGGLGRHNLAAAWLALASLTFYAWDNPAFLLPLISFSIVMNYMFGMALSRARKGILLAAAIGANLAFLGYFKYAMFFFDVLRSLGVSAPELKIELPIGISFYTFTQIAFLVDAYRGDIHDRSPIHYALFVTLFPHLIAGPILHHGDVIPQFQDKRIYRINWSHVAIGLTWFAFGLVKKVLLADNIATFADPVFTSAGSERGSISFGSAWTAAVSYAFQIYFDFSGYSDMAVGLAILLGISFPPNFYSPFKALSIIDFWRRWHITLSRFLRDYLYIPLGGSRNGRLRTYANFVITFTLGGLWHGASWTFVLWGAINGIALVVNHLWREAGARMPAPLAGALTFLFVTTALVVFRANSVTEAMDMLASMFGVHGFTMTSTAPSAGIWIAGLAVIIFLAPNTSQLLPSLGSVDGWKMAPSLRRILIWKSTWWWALSLGALCGFAAAMAATHPVAFLYFRF